MSKAETVFYKLAKKKKKAIEDVNPAIPIGMAGTAAVGGLAYSLKKPAGVHSARVPKKEVDEFLRKLKPGDVLTTGSYNTGKANPFQVLLNRGSKQYHSAVYLGKGHMTEMIPYGMKKPRPTTDKYLLRNYANTETFQAHRPKITPKETKEMLRGVRLNQKKYVYDAKDSAKAYIKNKIEKVIPTKAIMKKMSPERAQKVFGCKGKFCSNLASSHLPQKLFNVHKTVAMPKDYHNPKFFEYVGKLEKPGKVGHLAASNKSLWRYAGKPALIAGGLLAAADATGVI